jgi:hypothetical protein
MRENSEVSKNSYKSYKKIGIYQGKTLKTRFYFAISELGPVEQL